MSVPTWAQLVAVMLVGDGTDVPFHGLLLTEPDVEPHRVWIHGARYRRERPDGGPLAISDGDSVWLFDPDRPGVPDLYPADSLGIAFPDQRLTVPPLGPLSSDDVGDLGRLVRQPVATTLHGREAWRVEMELEPWKSGTFWWTIDAERGFVLEESLADGTLGDHWLELTVGEEAPPGTFAWDGPSRPAPVDDEPSAAELARAAELRQVEQLGLQGLRVPFSGDLSVHESARDGSFEVELVPQGYAMLTRRPVGSPRRRGWTTQHVHRWSDDRWDWTLAVDEPLSDAELDALRARLPD